MNILSLVTRFRSMSWRRKAAIFAATTVFVMVVLANNSEPLTPYEQAFVGVWLDAHPNATKSVAQPERMSAKPYSLPPSHHHPAR